MATWKVKDGTQVKHKGKLYAAGDTFTATEDQVTADALTAYVDPVKEKAQTATPNKAQQSTPNKSK